MADPGPEPAEALDAAAAVPGVGAGQHVEQRRRMAEVGPAAHQQPGVAHLGGRGPAQVRRQTVAEGADERPQLVVGVEPVGVDEGAGQVVRLDLDVGPQPRPVDAVDAGAQGLDLGGEVVDEGTDGLVEGGGDHRGSRHMGHSGGPAGRSIRPVTPKPKRS